MVSLRTRTSRWKSSCTREWHRRRSLEAGDSFSVGQRRRAMLRGSQVLLMDEATSSVDIDTDRRIQELVREEFKN